MSKSMLSLLGIKLLYSAKSSNSLVFVLGEIKSSSCLFLGAKHLAF